MKSVLSPRSSRGLQVWSLWSWRAGQKGLGWPSVLPIPSPKVLTPQRGQAAMATCAHCNPWQTFWDIPPKTHCCPVELV